VRTVPAISPARRAAHEAEARHRERIERALTQAFWRGLSEHPMEPMVALEAAAATVGALYRQVAAGHRGPNGCPCGWEPEPDSDLIVLEATLAAALLGPPKPDLARMPAAGRA